MNNHVTIYKPLFTIWKSIDINNTSDNSNTRENKNKTKHKDIIETNNDGACTTNNDYSSNKIVAAQPNTHKTITIVQVCKQAQSYKKSEPTYDI